MTDFMQYVQAKSYVCLVFPLSFSSNYRVYITIIMVLSQLFHVIDPAKFSFSSYSLPQVLGIKSIIVVVVVLAIPKNFNAPRHYIQVAYSAILLGSKDIQIAYFAIWNRDLKHRKRICMMTSSNK